jgi:hypothetical protein
MTLEPAGTAVSSSAPIAHAGGEQLLELARSTDQDLAGAGQAAPGSAAAPPAISLERELAGMFAMMAAAAGQFLPAIRRVLNDEACKQLGDALAPVARKYDLAKYLEGFAWRVELQAIMVTVPIAFAVVAAAKHDLAAIRAAQSAAADGNLHPLGANLQPGAATSPAEASAAPPAAPRLQPIEQTAP